MGPQKTASVALLEEQRRTELACDALSYAVMCQEGPPKTQQKVILLNSENLNQIHCYLYITGSQLFCCSNSSQAQDSIWIDLGIKRQNTPLELWVQQANGYFQEGARL